MEKIKYKLTNEFFIVILVAFAVAIIDIVLYIAFPMIMQLLLVVAGVMIFVALKYLMATLTTYIILSTNQLKIREYGPLSLISKCLPYDQLDSAILVGQTLTIYYNQSKSVDVELCDMSPTSALLFTEYLQGLGLEIKKPGDIRLGSAQKNEQICN
jgi:hypothetical protein